MASPEVRTRRFTRAEYERMVEQGIIAPDERVELLDGEIVVMAAKGSRHTTATNLLAKALERAFARGFTVRRQDPLALGVRDEPESDIAVVAGSDEDYRAAHPRTAVLVVEVSDSTVEIDHGRKLRLYARAKIPEYWIVNLRDDVLEVWRKPVRVPHGFAYEERTLVSGAKTVTPLAAPKARIPVAPLFR